MIHFKSSVSGLCAIAVAVGVGACSRSSQTKTVAPTAAGPAPATAPEYASPQGAAAAGTAAPSAMASDAGAPEAPATAQQTWESGGSPGTSGAVETSPSPAAGVTNPMGGMDVSSFDDPELAAVVQAINMGEVEEARLAEAKAASAAVRRFAQRMTSAHREMMNKNSALLARLQIVPSDNAVSNELKSDTQSEITSLQSLRGRSFDRDYVDSQVRDHNKALELFDRMVPTVKNAELRAEYQSERPKIEAHLRDAERLQQSLEKGSTNAQPPVWHGGPPQDSPMGPQTR